MVGVPGRSKACYTCKQRRIRCNEEGPQCSNCIKSNRICGGYLRQHAFILSEGMLALEPAASQAISGNAESSNVMVGRWRINPSRPSQRTSKLEVTSVWLPHQHSQRTNSLPGRISSHHAGRQQLLETYFTNYYPSEVLISRATVAQQLNWLWLIQDAPALTPALESSILAVCLADLGRRHDDRALIREALSMYTKGLHELRQAVRNPRSRLEDETIAACIALVMFETIQCTDQSIDSCMAHHKGAMNLLLLRPPEAYTSGLAHCLFLQLRIQSVFMGMQMRSRIPFTDIRWRELPWKSAKKGLRDLLIDILLEIPEVFHRTDQLARESRRSKMFLDLIDVVELCWRIDSEFNKWYSCFETFVAGPVYWPKLSTRKILDDGSNAAKVFAVAFHFPSSDVGQTMIMYWLGLLVLYPNLCGMYEQLEKLAGVVGQDTQCSCIADPFHETTDSIAPVYPVCVRHFTTDKLPPLGHRKEWAQNQAMNICQSAEYFMREEMSAFGPNIFMPRLVVVREVLAYASGDWTRERQWITDLLKEFEYMGNNILKYL